MSWGPKSQNFTWVTFTKIIKFLNSSLRFRFKRINVLNVNMSHVFFNSLCMLHSSAYSAGSGTPPSKTEPDPSLLGEPGPAPQEQPGSCTPRPPARLLAGSQDTRLRPKARRRGVPGRTRRLLLVAREGARLRRPPPPPPRRARQERVAGFASAAGVRRRHGLSVGWADPCLFSHVYVPLFWHRSLPGVCDGAEASAGWVRGVADRPPRGTSREEDGWTAELPLSQSPIAELEGRREPIRLTPRAQMGKLRPGRVVTPVLVKGCAT